MPEKEISWYEAVDVIGRHVVRISTPRGSGTGFLVSYGKTNPTARLRPLHTLSTTRTTGRSQSAWTTSALANRC